MTDYCACGCGTEIIQKGYYRTSKFIQGHNSFLRRGSLNPNYGKRGPETSTYKIGRTKSGDGKYWILSGKQGYPRADQAGRILEHIYVYQEYHKVCLLKGVQIHHKNKDGLDNRISNLEVISPSEHTKIHFPRKDRENTFCITCGGKTTTDKRGYDRWHKYQDGYRCDICYKRAMREQGKIE
jgi:hypothetical protein